jgi:cation diffusion facilitator CzcD-associated flavoprotein CzcO
MRTQPYDVVIVGAGFAGIGSAIQFKRLGYERIAILDREDDLGGTWHVNRYPGLAVDVATTTYSFWFEPNPYWSRLFSRGEEIKRYANHVVDKYDLRRHMRFKTTVEGARWDEDAKLWRVKLAGGETLDARFLVTATGFLSQPHTPDIPGIDTFAGKIIHTAAWDDSYELDKRRVGIIGTGATAVQLIPKLAKKAADLTVYQRTPIWVVPKFDIHFSKRSQELFARLPFTQRAVRGVTDAVYEVMIVTGVTHHRYFPRLNNLAARLANYHRVRTIRDKKLRKKLKPDYDFGCKRPTFSNSYYRAFNEPHVHLETTGIARIEPDGIVTKDGKKTVIDTLVLATGFDLWEKNFPAIEVIGREGRNLGKWWREGSFEAYQGVSIPHFPNYLSLTGPFAFQGLSFFNMMEFQMRHMARLFGELERRGAKTFEVNADASRRYVARMSTLIEKNSLFFRGSCATSRSYYFNAKGEAPLLRPVTTRTSVREASRFPLSDYQFA